MPINSQLGIKKETTYGTPVTVDRFTEYLSEGIKPVLGRNYSKGLRAGQRGMRTSSVVPFVKRYEGPLQVEVLSKGFGFWLEHIMGSVATGSAEETVVYTHTGSIASHCGDGFTLQVNRPLGACADTDQAFTWSGGKVMKAAFSCAVDGNLICDLDLVFADGTTATGLASASYPSGAEVMSWLGGYLTVDTDDIPVKDWKVTIDNKLDPEKMRMTAAGGVFKEPTEADHPEVSAEFTCDWESLDFYNKVIANTAAGATGELILGAGSPGIIGDTLTPRLQFTMPGCIFEDAGTTVSGPAALEQSVKVMAGNTSGSNMLTIAYRTLDTTP